MYKLIDSFDDALVASTSIDPTDYVSAFTAQTSGNDIFIQGIVNALESGGDKSQQTSGDSTGGK